MAHKLYIPQKVTAILVYGRSPLVFAGLICAIAVMWNQNPVTYTFGVLFLFIAMTFDLVDGWFAARFVPQASLAHLADKIMDKVVYSIIFPLIAVGMMWRLYINSPNISKIDLLHAIFILLLCITVLIRDNFAQFMRGFAIRKGQEPELSEYTRLRTIVAAPVSALLYAYAFYIPEGPPSKLYYYISWMGNLPLRGLFLVEIIFLIINFGSIAGYCRKYGNYCLDELCLGNEQLRRSILAFFPNALTVMNAMMGLLSVFFAYQDRIREAYLILIGAAMFDKLDGAVARKLGIADPVPSLVDGKRHISLGSIMDDISDAVSFCIVPGWIFYILLSGFYDPVLNKMPVALIAFLYSTLGIARLIYFTIDKTPIPGFFKGMPTPSAALLVVAPLIMFNQAVMSGTLPWIRFWGVFCCGLMIFAGIIMNLYPIRYIHLGRFMDRQPWFSKLLLFILIVSVLTPFFGHISFTCLVIYLLSPVVTWRIQPETVTQNCQSDSDEVAT